MKSDWSLPRVAVDDGIVGVLHTTRTKQAMTNGKRRSAGRLATVRTSPIHGSGLFALRDLARGRRIGVYGGRRYEPDADREWDPGLIYIFRLSDGSSIDGSDGGNDLRHINHSCEPNCAAFEIEQKDRSIAIVIETVRSVQSDEELLLDYALDVADADERDFLCSCGASKCRGTMVAV
jgi:SET domain-containing protein